MIFHIDRHLTATKSEWAVVVTLNKPQYVTLTQTLWVIARWSHDSQVILWHQPTRPASDLVATSSQSTIGSRARLVEPLTEAQEHRHASLRTSNQRDDLWRLRGLGPAETRDTFRDWQLCSEFCHRISTNRMSQDASPKATHRLDPSHWFQCENPTSDIQRVQR